MKLERCAVHDFVPMHAGMSTWFTSKYDKLHPGEWVRRPQGALGLRASLLWRERPEGMIIAVQHLDFRATSPIEMRAARFLVLWFL